MNRKICFHSLLVCLVLSSCSGEIDLEYLRPDPKLVLNCVAESGKPLTASITRTWFYTEENPDVLIKNAAVQLYVNDQLQEQLQWNDSIPGYNRTGCYVGSYIPKESDRIRLTASAPNFQDVHTECDMPKPVGSMEVKTSLANTREVDYWYYSDYEFSITFTDNPNQKDFYLLAFEIYVPVIDNQTQEPTGENIWVPLYVNYSKEPLFNSSLTALDKIMGYDWLWGGGGRVFTDDLIKGKTYTIRTSATPANYIPSESYESTKIAHCRVYLYTISEGYYQYLKSCISIKDDTFQQSLSESGLAEPVRIFSNITGGVGILGSGNPVVQEVDITLSWEYPNTNQ